MSGLLQRHRQRLKRMVAVRLDDRLAGRVDPSDVVQETLLQAARELERFARGRPLPFYPWLRKLALRRLARLRRFHLGTGKRAAAREEGTRNLPDRSAWQLADQLVGTETGPAARVLKSEQREHVRGALARLPEADREVLVLRYLEQLAMADIAEVLGITPNAAKLRHLRALRRMRELLGEWIEGEAT